MTSSPTEHTNGPWSYSWETESRNWAIVTDSAGSIIANVNTETGPDAQSAPATRKMPADANARLIAAAPDLLEVCKGLLAKYDFGDDLPEDHPIVAARAALSRVSGEGR
jgi:hypothetical protein